MGQPLWKINENIEKYNRILSYYIDDDIIYRTYKRGKQIKLQKFRFDMSESKWRWFHVYGYYLSNSKLILPSSVYGSREDKVLKEISIKEANNIIDKTKMLFELRR